jgi:4-amino-4-deoxy-L-arabinose transferase-like glycosyltransferase
MGRILKMKNINKLLLITIITAGFLVRITNITKNPPELFSDEIKGFISAKSMIETGKDIDGKARIFFYNRLELYPPIYGYLTYITSLFIKSNPILAIRIPAVIFGTASIVTIFFLSQLLFNNVKISFFIIIFYTFTPWSIHFSRVGWEPSLLTFFLFTPIALFKLYSKENDKPILLYLSSLILGLGVYAYRSMEFYAPIFLFILIILFWKKTNRYRQRVVISIIIFSATITPFITTSAKETLMHERAKRISTFAEGINHKSIKIFAHNYIKHFSPNFLFISGDPNLRHGTGTGEIYWIMLPLILIGIFTTFKNIKKNEFRLILIMLLIYPLGGSLTNDGVPHATRTLIGAPLFAILSGLGLFFITQKFRKYSGIFVAFFLVTFSLESSNFLIKYFSEYPKNSQGYWEYGQREIFSFIKEHSNNNDSMCLTNIDYWHEETLIKFYLGANNKYKIVYDRNDPRCLTSKILVLRPQLEAPKSYYQVQSIYDLERKPIWIIYIRQ